MGFLREFCPSNSFVASKIMVGSERWADRVRFVEARRAVSGSWDKTLRVWDLSGNVIATFVADSPLHPCAIMPDRLTFAGDASDQVHFLV
jgi:hypothetical protein